MKTSNELDAPKNEATSSSSSCRKLERIFPDGHENSRPLSIKYPTTAEEMRKKTREENEKSVNIYQGKKRNVSERESRMLGCWKEHTYTIV